MTKYGPIQDGKVIIGFLFGCLCLSVKASYDPADFNVINATPSNYGAKVSSLVPGDWLALEAGVYTGNLRVLNLHGAANNLIVVSGPATGEGEAVFERQDHNTIHVDSSSYVVIRNLRLDGTTSDIGMALRGRNTTHNITLEKLVIRDYANSVAIATSGEDPAWHWTIRNVEIRNASTGMYLGQYEGRSPFVGGLIENCVIADTGGYNIQIKHQNDRNYEGMPQDRQTTIIRNNIFINAGQASARPNLLVGHFPPSGAGSDDQYLIYNNLFFENASGEYLFQGEGHVALYNNLFFNSANGGGIHIKAHNDVPKRIHVFRNTLVITDWRPIRIADVDTAYEQRVAGNATFSDTSSSYHANVTRHDNREQSREAANTDLRVAEVYTALEDLDLRPDEGKLEKEEIDFSVYDFPDLNRDYTGGIRLEFAYGAYATMTAWLGDDKTPLWWVDSLGLDDPQDGEALTMYEGYLLNQQDLNQPFRIVDIGLDEHRRAYLKWLSSGPSHGYPKAMGAAEMGALWQPVDGEAVHAAGTNTWTSAETAPARLFLHLVVEEAD